MRKSKKVVGESFNEIYGEIKEEFCSINFIEGKMAWEYILSCRMTLH